MQTTLGLPCRPRSGVWPQTAQLLAEWTETFQDFQEESTISHLKGVVGRIAPVTEWASQAQSPFNLSPPSTLGTTSPIPGWPLGPHLPTHTLGPL